MANPTDPIFSNDGVGQNNIGLNTHRASDVLANNPNNDLQSASTTPSTNSLLETSTNIFIYANNNIVGMIQNFSVNESRSINKLQSIGYEGVIQAVPSNTNGGTLQVSRLALYGSNIWRALGLTMSGQATSGIGARVHQTGLSMTGDAYIDDANPAVNPITANEVFRTLRDQRVPLEIVYRRPMDGAAATFYEEHYVDCWLQNYSTTYSVGTITVTEQASISYGDVY